MSAASGHKRESSLRLSPAATQDIEDVLAWTELQFGEVARLRYEALLACAIRDLLADPSRPGLQSRPELGAGVFSFHLHFSRKRAALQIGSGVGWVHRPRHLLIGRLGEAGSIDIARLLHDSMEMSRHLPSASDEARGPDPS